MNDLIRRGGLRDLEGILSLEKACFPGEAWSRNVFLEDLARPSSFYLVAEIEPRDFQDPTGEHIKQLIGYIACATDPVHRYGHISSLAVDPDHRSQGIGGRLLDDMLALLEAQGIECLRAETRLSNRHVQEMFRIRGFLETEQIPRYYQNPTEAAVVMIRWPGESGFSQGQRIPPGRHEGGG